MSRGDDPKPIMLAALAFTFSACLGLIAFLFTELVTAIAGQRAGVF